MVDSELTADQTPVRPWGKLLASLLLGLGLASVTFQLGQWQTGRAAEKMALHEQQLQALKAEAIRVQEAKIDLDALAYRQVSIPGQFDPQAVVYIDNRQVNGRPALQVVQGFKPAGAGFLIPVDRGLLLRDPAQPRGVPPMPVQAVSTGELLHATILPRFAQSAELWGMSMGKASEAIHKEQAQGRQVWSNFSGTEFAGFTGQPVSNYVLTVQPVVFDESKPSEALVQQGFYLNPVKLPEQVAKHQGYAFQWFAMTTVLIGLTAFFMYREFFVSAKKS